MVDFIPSHHSFLSKIDSSSLVVTKITIFFEWKKTNTWNRHTHTHTSISNQSFFFSLMEFVVYFHLSISLSLSLFVDVHLMVLLFFPFNDWYHVAKKKKRVNVQDSTIGKYHIKPPSSSSSASSEDHLHLFIVDIIANELKFLYKFNRRRKRKIIWLESNEKNWNE